MVVTLYPAALNARPIRDNGNLNIMGPEFILQEIILFERVLQ